jgi:spore coat protein H
LFKTIPHFTSARTQLVRLYINGKDHGLYTMIEELDKRFLRSHGLDPKGQLYKGAHYHFDDIDPEVIANPSPDDDYYNSLDYLLEDKANPDLAKLLRMVEAVNDEDLDSETVIATYFNRDNLATWLAVNVLLNNVDTVTQNYYLYSPSSCEGWYLLPWDYDGAFNIYGQGSEDSRKRFRSGLANWWRSRLFKRFFQDEANVQAVHDRIVELQGGAMSDENVAALLTSYDAIVSEYISRMPDLAHVPHAPSDDPEAAVEVRHAEIDRISRTVSRFYAEYRAAIERPMPVHQSFRPGTPLRFRWSESFDLQGDPITYDLEVSKSPTFQPKDLVVEQRGLTVRETTVESLAAGRYHWRVIIRDDKGPDTWQLPFEEAEEIVIR